MNVSAPASEAPAAPAAQPAPQVQQPAAAAPAQPVAAAAQPAQPAAAAAQPAQPAAAAAQPAQPAAAAAQPAPAASSRRRRSTTKPAKATALTIASVSIVPDINVANGTLLTSFNLPNPVAATLSDGSICSILTGWKNAHGPIYDSKIADTYAFVGTLIMPSNAVTNPLGLTASVKVIVASKAGANRHLDQWKSM